MIVKEQKPLVFLNACNARFDARHLEQAILMKTDKPVSRLKKVFMYGKYPAVSIHGKKYHVHRLLTEYWGGSIDGLYVHHKNHDKLDATLTNLEVMTVERHQSHHNKGKTVSEATRQKLTESNKRNWSTKWKHRRIYENPELLKETN